MGIALIKIRIMPVSPEVDLEIIKTAAKKAIEKNKGKNVSFNEEPIAFGLKAIIAGFDLDESDGLEPVEDALGKIENISSVQVVDMRRAFG